MRLFLLIILTTSLYYPARSQSTHYPQEILPDLNSLLVQVHKDWQQKNNTGITQSLLKTDRLLQPVQSRYPLFAGIMNLHQAYYAADVESRKKYLEQGLGLLKGANHSLVDSFDFQLYWLISSFYDDNRINEWARVDSVLRYAVLDNKTDAAQFHYAITTYADKKLAKEEYPLAKSLAGYEKIFFENIEKKTTYDKLTIIFNKWLLLRTDLEQWFKVSYSMRNNSTYGYKGIVVPAFLSDKPEYETLSEVNYKNQFVALFKELNELKKEMVLDNSRQLTNYNEGYRKTYYDLYTTIINKFYEWAVNDYKHSEAILPLKQYLFQDVIANEIKDAHRAKKEAFVNTDHFIQLFTNLSALYYAVGNGAQATEMINRGRAYFLEGDYFTKDQQWRARVSFAPYSIRAARLQGNTEVSLRTNQLMKRMAPAPDSLSPKTLIDFEWYAEARFEEVYTLLALNKREQATDSLSLLMNKITEIPSSSEDFIYTTKAWTNLQFLSATVLSQKGKWHTDLINEMVNDLVENRTHLEIFYPAQLLDLKATFKKYNIVPGLGLANLLIYTERQLKSNFILLSAEERMRLYEQRLNSYFDVYHELLFSGRLDSMPALKEKVIAQSLHLKNALADGNVIGDGAFSNGNHGIPKELLDEVRTLRQATKMNLQKFELHKFETDSYQESNDQMQSIWLNILDGPGKDSLVTFPSWKKMGEQLKAGQVYIETVRYNSWLNDSAAVYAAFIILPGKKIQLLKLCTEDSLIALLQDPSASPQTTSLDAPNKRGTELLVAANKKRNPFKPGDTDKLAALLVTPLWKYINGNKELLMVQDGLLNRISFASLQWQQKYLLQYVQLRQLSGSYMLAANPMPRPTGTKALLSGGLQYGSTPDTINSSRLFKPVLSWGYLPGTLTEINQLQPMFTSAGYETTLLTGEAFSDTLRKSMEGYSFIHLATHGFYFDTLQAKQFYADKLSKDAIKNEPLYRCGLALSGANNPLQDRTLESQGYLLGYELANTDLRNCYLISLSACETGLGDVRNNLGVDGLSRALKIGGARHLLISLWKVPDVPTAIFMKQFYTYLFTGKTPAAALQATQLMMSKNYPASDWAAFILVE